MIRMTFKSGINDLLTKRMVFKPFSNDIGILTMEFHTSLKSLHTSKSKIGIKSRGVSTNTLSGEEELVIKSFILNNKSTTNNIGVSTDVLA